MRMVCLYFVSYTEGDCILATDSGGNKRYLVGRLDTGEVFVERVASSHL